MLNELKQQIKKSNKIVYFYDKLKQMYMKNVVSDEKFIIKEFKKNVGREVNLQNPVKYNDKLQWLKLNWRDPIATKCVDKYEVRELIEEKVGGDILNEIYEVYDGVDKVDINKLPNSFVLKGTHGSGYNIICEDKNKVNWKLEFKKMHRWMSNNFYWSSREWVYKDVKPRIIAEKFMRDFDGKPPMDYKIFCFHGEPKLIQVDIDRFGVHKQNFYDTEWNFRDIEIWCDNDKKVNIQKPIQFDRMLQISRELSKPFPHVRVDLYNMDDKIIFGELTFFHLTGMQKFRDEELELEMGSWLNLKKIDSKGVYHYE